MSGAAWRPGGGLGVCGVCRHVLPVCFFFFNFSPRLNFSVFFSVVFSYKNLFLFLAEFSKSTSGIVVLGDSVLYYIFLQVVGGQREKQNQKKLNISIYTLSIYIYIRKKEKKA